MGNYLVLQSHPPAILANYSPFSLLYQSATLRLLPLSLIVFETLYFMYHSRNMKSLLLLPIISVVSSAVVPRQTYFSFGNYFSTGPVATSSWIRQATTTLVLPALNSPHNGNLGLWPGMGTKFDSGADGQLIQGLAISTIGNG